MDESWLNSQRETLHRFFPGVDFAVDDAGCQIGFDRIEFASADTATRKEQIQKRIDYLTDGHTIVHNDILENLLERMLHGTHRANMVFFVSTTMPDGSKRIELRCTVWNERSRQYDDKALVKSIVIYDGEKEENAKMELYRQMFVELY